MEPVKVYKGILAIKLVTIFNVEEISTKKKIVKSRKSSYNKTN